MRENTKRLSSPPPLGRHVLSFALLGLLLAGATFVLGVSAGRRMAQTPTRAHENNPLVESDKKTEALAQIQQEQTGQPSLTFQEELIKPISVALAARPAVVAPVSKPVKESPVLSEPSAQIPTRTVARQGSLKEAFLELEQEGREVSKKESSKRVGELKEWTLQVSSHKGEEEAQRVAAKLGGMGYTAHVVSAELGEKGTWHRVRVGQFASRQEAEMLAEKLVTEMRMLTPLVISLK